MKIGGPRLGRPAVLLVAALVLAGPARAANELIVRYRAGATAVQVARAKRDADLRLKEHVRTAAMPKDTHPGLELMETALETTAALAILRRNPAIEYAEPNYPLYPTATANDPRFTSGNMWGMYGDLSSPANAFGSQAAEAWAAGYTGSSGVYVAVIDDGAQIAHPDLAPNIWVNPFDPVDGIDNDGNGLVDDLNGWNFVAGNNTVFESGNDHGTHVAGTIGARGGNGLDVVGINWNVTIIPLKFISNGTGNTLNAVKAIDYCVDLKSRHGINLVAINASWGGSGYSSALHEAIIRAAKAGILFVAAAGNDGLNNDLIAAMPANLDTTFGTLSETPANYNSVISVAAIDAAGGLAWFSDYGATRVHIGAPGVQIESTFPLDTTAVMQGTSMATPHVTGAAALYASTHPTATASQIRAAILGAALPTASLAGKTTTGGRLNLSTVVAPSPQLEGVSAVLIAETLPNGVIDPGENVTVRLTLTNVAATATTALTGTLLASGDVIGPGGPQNFGGLIGGGAAGAGDFSFTAGGTCGQEMVLTLALQDGAVSLGTASFRLRLGSEVTLFSEDFDAVLAPALPAGWTATLAGAGAKWKTVASGGNNVMFAPNTSSTADNLLTSPIIHIGSGSAVLSFQHSFVLEPDWDGGVLEISIGGGAFGDIISAGGVFLQNGYDLLLNGSTTPLTNRPAWSGHSGGFITTRVQLPASCMNQDVRLRWRCGSDTSVGGPGWSVDSIKIVDGYACALPAEATNEDQARGPVTVLIGQADAQSGLSLSATSSNASLLPGSGIVWSGSGAARSVTLTPSANEFGTSSVTLKVESAAATSYRTFQFSVDPVNDAPAFLGGADVVVPQDSGAQVVSSWAGSISAGAANETGQVLTFEASADRPELFSSGPAISGAGTLTFTPAAHQRGAAVVSVQLRDDGGTDRSGQDLSTVQTFSITIGETTDSDGDGLPDDYETAFNFDPHTGSDGGADADGDGATNYQEFLAGTNPNDPKSVLRIVDSQVGSLQFSSIAGKTYQIEENSAFPAGPWLPVETGKAGTGNLVGVSDTGLTSEVLRIYRVKTTGENGTPVSSEYAGFCQLNLLGNSDTLVAPPFSRPAAEFGTAEAIAGSTVQFHGAPGWQSGQWVYAAGTQTNTFYLLVRSGVLEGEYFTITANTGDTVTLDAAGSELSGIAPGDALAIVPYWTLGTIFPGGLGVHASSGPAGRRSEILVPNINGTGVNLGTAATYFFLSGIWRRVGQGGAKNDDVVLPDMYIVVRHNVATNTTLSTFGSVASRKLRMLVRRNVSSKQDNFLALARPAAISLNDSGLVQSGAFRASPAPANRIDELLVFDNTSASRNKSATATYYYRNGIWRKIGSGSDAGTNLVFLPGTGVILRSGPDATSATWENSPGY